MKRYILEKIAIAIIGWLEPEEETEPKPRRRAKGIPVTEMGELKYYV